MRIGRPAVVTARVARHHRLVRATHIVHHAFGQVSCSAQRQAIVYPYLSSIDGALGMHEQLALLFDDQAAALGSSVLQDDPHQGGEQRF